MKCFGFNCASSLIASPYFLIVILENITWNKLRRKKWGLLSSPRSRELFGDKCSKIGTGTSLLQNKWPSQSLTDNDHWNICMLTGVMRTWSLHIFRIKNTAIPGKTKQLQKPAMASFSLQRRKLDIAPVTCHLPSHAHQPIISKNIWPILQPSLSWPRWTIDALLHGRDFFFSSAGTCQRNMTLKVAGDEMGTNTHILLGTLKPLRFFWIVVPHTETHKSKRSARPCSPKDITMFSESLPFRYTRHFTNSELELPNRNVHTNDLASW